ncbi:MAG: DUF58 domain-containing protein [Bifidobacteriaceae bacterium]|nr:DUF58 domain-containing protein [Bifidobacteriaceae bacterium]
MALTGRGLALLACGMAFLCAARALERADALVLGAALAAAPLAAFAAAAVERRRPRLNRLLPSRLVHAGESVAVTLLPDPGRRLRPKDLVADLTPSGALEARPVQTARAYRLALDRRGTYGIGPAVIRRLAPMGLARAEHILAQPTEVAVAPRLVAVAAPRLHVDAAEAAQERRLTAERVPDPASVRDYLPGDTRRMVHWRATLRRRRLMVRGDAPRAIADVWIVVDTVVPPRRPGGPDPADLFEHALSVAASLAVGFLRSGHRVRLAETGPRQFPDQSAPAAVFEPTAGTEPLLKAFAALEPQADDDGAWPSRLLDSVKGRVEPIPMLLVLADVTGERAAAAARLRRLADPAQAYLVGGAAFDRREALARAGWGAVEAAAP